MQSRDPIGAYINSNPRAVVKLIILLSAGIWQTIPVIFGMMIHLVLGERKGHERYWLIVVGLLVATICVTAEIIKLPSPIWPHYFKLGWLINKNAILAYSDRQYFRAYHLAFVYGFNFMAGFPVLIAGMLSLADLIPVNPHIKTLNSLASGKGFFGEKELGEKAIKSALNTLPDLHATGTILGVSKNTGDTVILDDKAVNQVALVLGTTGGGKTITLRRFFDRAVKKGYPLIIVDGKPSDENVDWIQSQAKKYGRKFYGFNCAEHSHYDPLANGGYTELKDKIISLKDEWENDYYRSIAEDYLQTTFEILIKGNEPFDLERIVQCLSFDELAMMARKSGDKEIMKRVKALENYERKDITGLQAHLNLLIHSEFGEYFKNEGNVFNLGKVIQEDAVVYFALPALRFPTFAKVLGKLVVNDIKAVIDREAGNKRIFTIFDEFSVFAGDQVLNLVNMGRGKGVHAIFGTQGLADLERVDTTFEAQIMNCANTIICHRLNDQKSVESVANWVGTKDVHTVTAQISTQSNIGGMGSVRQNKEFIIHPDSIKQSLRAGEAYLVSKVDGFRVERIAIKM